MNTKDTRTSKTTKSQSRNAGQKESRSGKPETGAGRKKSVAAQGAFGKSQANRKSGSKQAEQMPGKPSRARQSDQAGKQPGTARKTSVAARGASEEKQVSAPPQKPHRKPTKNTSPKSAKGSRNA